MNAPRNALDNARHRIDHANQTQPAPQIAVRHILIGIALSIVFTVVFARLLDFVKDNGTDVTPFDRDILFWMFHHRARPLTQAATMLAHLGSPPVIAGLAAVAALVGFFWHKVRGAAWTLPIAIIGAGIIIQGVKLLIHRHRPGFFTPLLHESGFSFPSGHSLIAMVVYGLLGYFALHLFRSFWARLAVRIVTVLLIVAIGVSRVYVGVHFPTDVLAGWTAGIPWLIACLGLHEVLARRWPSSGEPVLTPQVDAHGDSHSVGGAAKTVLRG